MDDGLLEPLPLKPQAPPPKPPGDGLSTIVWITLFLLVAGLAIIWGIAQKAGPSTPPPMPTPTPLPSPTPTPDPALRAAAEKALGEFMAVFTPLRNERADLWAPVDWAKVVDVQSRADAAMAERDFPKATLAYAEARRLTVAVQLKRPAAVARLMAEAKSAYAKGESAAAVERLEAVRVLDADHVEAKDLLPRARVADQSFARLAAAKAAAERSDWAPAWVELEQLAKLDTAFPGSADVRSRVAEALGAEEFEEWISGALQALTAGDIDRANEFLGRAAAYRPDHPAVADLRAQVKSVLTQREVLELRDRAEKLEKDEKWREAHEVWLRMKSLDPQAPWITQGRDRTLNWQKLEERITQATAALNSPQAEVLSKEWPGIVGLPPGLKGKGDEFVRTWTLQQTPVRVRLVSDLETRITLQRVSRWEKPFREQVVELKPGRYVATGTRLGYRDVRVEFEVKPGSAEMTVDIRCTEGI